MSWVSLVCLLALSSAVLSVPLFPSGDGYGSSRIITPPPMDNYGSSRIITPPPTDNYGSTRIITPPPTDSYGSSRLISPPTDNYGSSRLISPPTDNYGSSRLISPPTDNYGSSRLISPPTDNYGSSRLISPPRLVSSGYGSEVRTNGYSAPLLPEMPTTRISSGYGSSFVAPPTTRVFPTQNYGGYGSSNRLIGGNELLVVEPAPPTQADNLCRGQLPQTVIPIENNRKFVVCLDDYKGTEQSCPKGLIYHEQSRRCERKLGPMEDFCVSQPCLNGGLCISTDSTFQCQCAPGFDGTVCELDAHYCQNNRPCGVDPSVRCQSFRLGAALEWICVSDDDETYGPDGQHIHRSQCDGLNGPHALAFTNKGFIMCSPSGSHYESCPGGTIWDGFTKACVWPDMEENTIDTRFIKSGYGSSYSSLPAPTRIVSSYDKITLPLPTRKIVSSYGSYGSVPETRRVSSYGGELTPPMPITKTFSSYGGELTPPPTKSFSSYGGELTPPMPITKTFSSYGGELTPPPTRSFSSYGGELTPPPTKSFSSYGSDLPVPETKTFSSYGGSRMVLPPPIVKTAPSYGGY